MELNNNKILVFVDWYLPAFKAGGPIRSVANLVSSLSDSYEFYIVTGDRDLGDEKAYEDVKLNEWQKQEKAHVIYLSKEKQNRKEFSRIINEVSPSFIYLNSLFSFSFTILPLSLKRRFSSIKYILAPRGMLGGGALEIKRNKKRIFIQISKALSFYKGIVWHATNEKEGEEIKSSFGRKCEVSIADNLASRNEIDLDQLISLKKEKLEEKRFLFVSRISRKKNVDLLIDWFNSISKENYHLDIIGTIEDKEFYDECMSKKSDNSRINIQAAIHPEKLKNYYSNAHFFCLPTRHENYGHVIIEALSYGCPVIISDQTPWRGLEKETVGWDIALDKPQKFIDVFEECINMEEGKYLEMSKKSYQFAMDHIYQEDVLKAYRKLFS